MQLLLDTLEFFIFYFAFSFPFWLSERSLFFPGPCIARVPVYIP